MAKYLIRNVGDLDMLPIQITVRSLPDSPAIENHIHKHFEKLQRQVKRVTYCHVVVDVTQNHKRQGKIFSIHIDLKIPGKELLISHKQNQDLYVAIRDGFNAIRKLIQKISKPKHANRKLNNFVSLVPNDIGAECYFNQS